MFRYAFIPALVAWVLLFPALGFADPAQEGKGGAQLPVPRFVSLGTDEVNLRAGPGLRYPIRLVVRREGLPVEVIREFDVWRQVRDKDGDEGWVHKSMLSGKRMAIVTGSMRTLYKKPLADSRPVAKLEPGVIVRLKGCGGEWCEIAVSGYAGWIRRSDIWGVYPQEAFGR